MQEKSNATKAREAAIISAIRNDKIVGRGSCSVIDECMTDSEVVLKFGCVEKRLRTPAAALKEARAYQEFWQDIVQDRFGIKF